MRFVACLNTREREKVTESERKVSRKWLARRCRPMASSIPRSFARRAELSMGELFAGVLEGAITAGTHQ